MRIHKEFKDMKNNKSAFVYAQPTQVSDPQSSALLIQILKDDQFVWHFTIRGPLKTDYEGGLYHGVIELPSQYPFKPPKITLLTHSGRF